MRILLAQSQEHILSQLPNCELIDVMEVHISVHRLCWSLGYFLKEKGSHFANFSGVSECENAHHSSCDAARESTFWVEVPV